MAFRLNDFSRTLISDELIAKGFAKLPDPFTGAPDVRASEVPLTFNALNKLISSGIGGRDIARNPQQNRKFAVALQTNVNAQLLKQGFVSSDPGGNSIFSGTSFLADFNNAQQSLRQEFVAAETERRFGPQNITSRTSTVGPSGVRTPVPGQGVSTTPTAAQRSEIAFSFRSPIQTLFSGESSRITQPTVALPKAPSPTIISGAGIQRRRVRGVQAPTILTSDADAPIGGRTLLG